MLTSRYPLTLVNHLTRDTGEIVKGYPASLLDYPDSISVLPDVSIQSFSFLAISHTCQVCHGRK